MSILSRRYGDSIRIRLREYEESVIGIDTTRLLEQCFGSAVLLRIRARLRPEIFLKMRTIRERNRECNTQSEASQKWMVDDNNEKDTKNRF